MKVTTRTAAVSGLIRGRVAMTRAPWLALLALVVALAAAPSAEAYIWWHTYDSGNSRIGRANNDGSEVNGSFVTGIYFGGGVASNGTHVWWGQSGSNPTMGAIGRASADGNGSDANKTWANAGTFCGTFDAAANASHVYWVSHNCDHAGTRWIRRAGVDDADSVSNPLVTQALICGFGIDGTYIYYGHGQYIGRANLDGTNPDPDWIDTGSGNKPCDVVADASHVYYTFGDGDENFLGRAAIDGSDVNNSWVTVPAYYSNLNLSSHIAQDGTYVYWGWRVATSVNGWIGRVSKADRTGNSQFVSAATPYGLAVDSLSTGADQDGDEVPDGTDNCPSVANTDQADNDADGSGDACDADDDNDGLPEGSDNCPTLANPGQENFDGDSQGDVCDPDDDGDGVHDASDNCPLVVNPDQRNDDKDALGRACDEYDIPVPVVPPPMRIVAVSTTNSSFAPGASSTTIRGNTAQKKGKVPRGTVFSFRLNQEAKVTIDFLRKKGGRKVKKKCKKPTAKNRGKRKCNLRVARLFRNAHSGANEVPFSGRIRGKALKPGRYVAVLTAKGDGGRSKSKVGFRVVRP